MAIQTRKERKEEFYRNHLAFLFREGFREGLGKRERKRNRLIATLMKEARGKDGGTFWNLQRKEHVLGYFTIENFLVPCFYWDRTNMHQCMVLDYTIQMYMYVCNLT